MPRLVCAIAFLLVAACTAAPAPSPTGTPRPTETPGDGFYLRAWLTQELPPESTFAWLPMLTIADRTLIDGNVAVDAMFPGPLMLQPSARWISDAGIATIIDEARRLGLLSERSDYTGGVAMPGAALAQLELHVDGQIYQLTGDTGAAVCVGGNCPTDPGAPAAFSAFWQRLVTVNDWLAPELGAPVNYDPQRLAVLLGPAAAADPGFNPNVVEWPFEQTFAQVGVVFSGGQGSRCATVTGDALAALLPILRDGNQLTVLVDSVGARSTPVVRVLVPGEPSPCLDE